MGSQKTIQFQTAFQCSSALFREKQNQSNPRVVFVQTEVALSFVLTHSFDFSMAPVKETSEAAFALVPAGPCGTDCSRGRILLDSHHRTGWSHLEVAVASRTSAALLLL